VVRQEPQEGVAEGLGGAIGRLAGEQRFDGGATREIEVRVAGEFAFARGAGGADHAGGEIGAEADIEVPFERGALIRRRGARREVPRSPAFFEPTAGREVLVEAAVAGLVEVFAQVGDGVAGGRALQRPPVLL
jgi:hypothetical protein